MQRILDDMRKANEELDEPSLVRLSIFNPNLWATIKNTVQQIMIESSTANSSSKPKETQYPKSHCLVRLT